MIPAAAGHAARGSDTLVASPVGWSPRDRRLDRDFGKMYEPKFPIAAQP